MLEIYSRWQLFNQTTKIPMLSAWILPNQKLNQAAIRFKKDAPHAEIILFGEGEFQAPSFMSFMDSFITKNNKD